MQKVTSKTSFQSIVRQHNTQKASIIQVSLCCVLCWIITQRFDHWLTSGVPKSFCFHSSVVLFHFVSNVRIADMKSILFNYLHEAANTPFVLARLENTLTLYEQKWSHFSFSFVSHLFLFSHTVIKVWLISYFLYVPWTVFCRVQIPLYVILYGMSDAVQWSSLVPDILIPFRGLLIAWWILLCHPSKDRIAASLI